MMCWSRSHSARDISVVERMKSTPALFMMMSMRPSESRISPIVGSAADERSDYRVGCVPTTPDLPYCPARITAPQDAFGLPLHLSDSLARDTQLIAQLSQRRRLTIVQAVAPDQYIVGSLR